MSQYIVEVASRIIVDACDEEMARHLANAEYPNFHARVIQKIDLGDD